MDPAEANRALYERRPGAYESRALQPAERALLRRLKGRWAGVEMLDVGVGSGRTAYTFAALTKRYVGIDYASAMIERCRERIGEDETTRFLVCDARRMTDALGERERFDLILFSYNGIDSVGHDDRRTILSQVRRLLAADGHFFFSSHSLAALPLRAERPRLSVRRPVRLAYLAVRWARLAVRLRRTNRAARGAGSRGWAQLRDEGQDFQGLWYYVAPEYQVAQLREAGLELVEAFGADGEPVDPARPGRDPWVSYLCRPLPTSGDQP